MNVVIRTDASLEIGTGHVMRCLTLAKQLIREGVEVSFICRSFPGNSISFIQDQGFHVHTLPSLVNQNHWQWMRNFWNQDAQETKLIIKSLNKKTDLLIIDHYELDAKWESELRSGVEHIMVIDDLADRPHDCDLLLDQNYYFDMQNRYKGLIPDQCIQLLGPDYVLLRDEFLSIDVEKIDRDSNVNNILVFFGGTDPTGETLKTLQAVKDLSCSDIEYTVVVGVANPQKEQIEQICDQISNVTFYCQVNNMAELMVKADLAVGAGGTTSWERCFLALPSITVIVANNQTELSEAVAEKGAMYCLGTSTEVTAKDIGGKILELCNSPLKRNKMIRNCWEIVNPKYVKERLVIKNIMELQK
ncbi:UDP-2,4-diacetamido-2,4,6-trideoxy-beta-L-altropyranose hydrolase [Peribacillus cavernae]|uniref:UDP-2,4-diacetamido-2,4, 6-trideoxy-beta-L-altropyranose hydrolase n=1 Tax=Peribacillus cavernae TaxID=1674310 RepID=A0A3S0TXA4_9BACI|nr:UDP-2,4-diacetamido-2,4,6-trideoxy-beta-L-altropyranose hydrolase [Peribacillus cavernae]MDQ0221215.1 UDP-2,4-diacetamido-2,4,6-trideoxy-beta-L-altropyranose hydrolase [Peribacillus cavernae]RUQ26568.1 UDP-2,4-diacetamido-2,4,6-trideoxy-beta-L-altropyranose hydrolase [Peribacillus cavernae]